MAGRTVIWKLGGAPADAPFLHVEIADTFWRRFLGLMGRKELAPSHALLILPCFSVHTCFMRFAIDAVFVKRQEDGESWRVEKAAQGLRPWLGVSVCGTADAVIELRQGEAERIGMTPGSVWEEVRGAVCEGKENFWRRVR